MGNGKTSKTSKSEKKDLAYKKKNDIFHHSRPKIELSMEKTELKVIFGLYKFVRRDSPIPRRKAGN